MAGYECQVRDGCPNDVVQLVTSLVTGATMGTCAEDLPVFLVGALAHELGVDPDRLYDTVRRFEQRELARRAKADAAAAAAANGGPDLGDDPDGDNTPDSQDQDDREQARRERLSAHD